MTKALFFLLAAITLAAPNSAWACAVCFSGSGGSLNAYYLATALMMFIPIFLIGGFVYWLVRKARQVEPEPDQA